MLTTLDLWKSRGIGCDVFFSVKSVKVDRDCQRSTKIVVEGTIFAFGFLKKYNLSLLAIEGRELDQCQAFDRLVVPMPTSAIDPSYRRVARAVAKLGWNKIRIGGEGVWEGAKFRET
jgi:hypothetical protein